MFSLLGWLNQSETRNTELGKLIMCNDDLLHRTKFFRITIMDGDNQSSTSILLFRSDIPQIIETLTEIQNEETSSN